eukprot:750499-Hanusia_phi.AAC.5
MAEEGACRRKGQCEQNAKVDGENKNTCASHGERKESTEDCRSIETERGESKVENAYAIEAGFEAGDDRKWVAIKAAIANSLKCADVLVAVETFLAMWLR